MIEIRDVTGAGESAVQPTPEHDRQLNALGFTRLGGLMAIPKNGDSQTVAVWTSPDGDAFAVPERNPRGDETLCYFRTRLTDGTIVDTSDEPVSLKGFFVGRTRYPVPGARYDADHAPGKALSEVWRLHRQRTARWEARPGRHETMAQSVALTERAVAVFVRAAQVGTGVGMTAFVAMGVGATLFSKAGGMSAGMLDLTLLLAGLSMALLIPASVAAARWLPAPFWPR